jgi:membrane-associated protein
VPEPDRRTVTLLVVLVAAFWILGTVANALAPTLIADHPLVLVALEPRNRYLLLTAGRVDLVPYVVFATLRRIASDPVYFALGHLYGDRSIRWLEDQTGPRGARFVRFTERGYRRFSKLAVFLFPGLVVCVLAGATGMKVRTFLLLNVIGTVAAVIVLRVFADQLEPVVLPITEWIDDNQTVLTVVSVGLAVGYVAYQRRRGGGEVDAVRELAELPDDAPAGDGDDHR